MYNGGGLIRDLLSLKHIISNWIVKADSYSPQIRLKKATNTYQQSLIYVSNLNCIRSSHKSKGVHETCMCILVHIYVNLKQVIYRLYIKKHGIKRGHIQFQMCFRNLVFDKRV